jgi:hypothetical protein
MLIVLVRVSFIVVKSYKHTTELADNCQHSSLEEESQQMDYKVRSHHLGNLRIIIIM